MNPLVAALRAALADTTTFYWMAHSAHWNVTGPMFFEYHSFLEGLYEDLHGAIDPLAERIRIVKGDAPTSLAELVAEASVVEFKSVDAEQPPSVFGALLAANAKTVVSLQRAFDAATAANEQGVANFLADRIDQHGKWGWFLRAVLAR